jgi:hypothetical protein
MDTHYENVFPSSSKETVTTFERTKTVERKRSKNFPTDNFPTHTHTNMSLCQTQIQTTGSLSLR